ncbi:MAG: T9SS type A sorting domain-containing protein [Flavobacteriia bacterium]|nr:T9SS type A sorting domain-containing protein [Flavobacteriia bacterium]
MKAVSLGLILIIPFIYFGQKTNKEFCSNVKIKSTLQKSNTLTVSQIAESEKYDVTYYKLDLNVDNLSTLISGTVEIHAFAKENLDSALFELFNTLAISQIRLNGIPVNFSRNNSAVKVPVNALIGNSFILSIDYNGTPPTALTNPLGGSGLTNDYFQPTSYRVTWSLSQPFSAYEWWPCKQSLKDKADSCAVNITVPSSCKAGSNGILQNVIDLGNGKSRYEWKHNHPIECYLISIAVGEYIDYSIYANPIGSSNPVLIQNYILPDYLNFAQAQIDETVDFIELYASIYGPYPFQDEKYGHCLAPISGGMEHQTMTTQGYFEKSITAHELAHQWFGDNVTCASWADIWVNEGFAAYSENLMLENLYPVERAQDMLDRHTSVMSQFDGSIWVVDSLNSNSIFNYRLTYEKGAAFIYTLRYILNNDAQFFQALRNYQNNFKDSVAIGLDVKNELELASGLDLNNAFQEWYYGEGYPTYSAKWNLVNNNLIVEITQSTSFPTVTPLFTNPIDLKFTRSVGGDTIIRFPISANLNHFEIANIPNVTSLSAIDPNNWIINKMGFILHDINLLQVNTVSLNEKNMIISPNPTNGPIHIKVENKGLNQIAIFDSKGKQVWIKTFQNEIDVDLNQFQEGTFLIKIESENGEFKTHKIVKNN